MMNMLELKNEERPEPAKNSEDAELEAILDADLYRRQLMR